MFRAKGLCQRAEELGCAVHISAVHQPFMFQFEFQHNVYWIIKIKNYLLLLYMPAGGGGATAPSLG